MRIAFAVALITGTFLSACAGINAVSTGKPFDAGDGITVQPQTAWAAQGQVWTVDGFALNQLRFTTGIQSGKALFGSDGAKGVGTYSSDMLPNDVMDMVASTMKVGTAALRPAPFGPVMGFRFDISYLNDGLRMKGTALFAQRQGKLDLILFIAPEEYYFDHTLPAVEQVFGSIRVADKT
jgi:hypothetical protein